MEKTTAQTEWDESSEVDGFPKFIKMTPDENYLVKTRRHIYKLKELEWGKVERARKRNPDGFNETVLSDSILEVDGKAGTFGELQIKEWKGGDVVKLSAALNYIYEVGDFL